MAETPPARLIKDLQESGLLWLINRVVFHPRGFALGLVIGEGGAVVGWRLQGDGSETWRFEGFDEDELFRAAEATFAAAARSAMEHG
jgi:hypothetical protein